MLPRFFCAGTHAQAMSGYTITLPEEAAHHARRVLRLRPGCPITLFGFTDAQGRGGQWRAQLDYSASGQAQARLEEWSDPCPEPQLQVIIAQALPAADKMDWVVQKGVELGVSAIDPLITQRVVLRLSAERMARRTEHWARIAQAACAQCGRNVVPRIAPPCPLVDYLANLPESIDQRYVLVPTAGKDWHSLPPPDRTKPLLLLIGPEGGFDPSEERALAQARCIPLTLGPRVLRTETVGAAVLAALMAQWGDWSSDSTPCSLQQDKDNTHV
jgi:16S rRNA (uracil1498-N3)-methyltransferase